MMTTRLALAFSLALAACVATAGPPPAGPAPMQPAGPPPGGAVDNGQPHMQATLQALAGARAELAAAEANKGGHREKALEAVDAATREVQAGMAYAQQHPNEVGPAEGPAAPIPVNEEVPGGNAQPHMRNAIIQLREARKQLESASRNKGGHRQKGLELINDAIRQTYDGIKFAEHR